MTKRYALLVISTEPIDVGKLKEQKGVVDFFNEEFDIKPKGWGWIIKKPIPERGGGNLRITGFGKTVSVAITDWFRTKCGVQNDS